ncbi:MAG: thermonuclease family protein [Verrucomicrobiaceae bacterium]|nr:thermonuclease family protein [Verrucomicrobiaceae bacterium]
MPSETGKKPGFTNLLITIGVVLTVTLLAIAFKKQPVREERTGPQGALPKAEPVGVAKPVSAENIKPVAESFEEFPNATLINTPDNEPDTFKVQTGRSGELVFTLYFVDALETSFKQTRRIKEQATHFEDATTEAIVETGRDAMTTVTQLLSARPFRLLTRWERDPDSKHYLALVLVQTDNGNWTYLADMLVRQGFARVHGISTRLPDSGRALEDYNAELRTHAKYARDRKLGIWARVKV